MCVSSHLFVWQSNSVHYFYVSVNTGLILIIKTIFKGKRGKLRVMQNVINSVVNSVSLVPHTPFQTVCELARAHSSGEEFDSRLICPGR